MVSYVSSLEAEGRENFLRAERRMKCLRDVILRSRDGVDMDVAGLIGTISTTFTNAQRPGDI